MICHKIINVFSLFSLFAPSVEHSLTHETSHRLHSVCLKVMSWKNSCGSEMHHKKQRTNSLVFEYLRLTWAPSLSGCSSSSSASDAPRWPENTERSLTSNRSDGGLRPARAADPATNHTPPSQHSPGIEKCRVEFEPPGGAMISISTLLMKPRGV